MSLPLTDRQSAIYSLVGQGLTSKQIAHQLGLSSKTVDAHKHNIMQRKGLPNFRALLIAAVRDTDQLKAAQRDGTKATSS